MYDQLAPLAARFITVTPHNPRALDAGELAAFLRRYGKPVTACGTIREGVSRMLADTPPDGTAVCCGSLYLLGDVVQSLERYKKRRLRRLFFMLVSPRPSPHGKRRSRRPPA